MLTKEPARSIPGESRFLKSTDGWVMVREERCPHPHPVEHGLCHRRLVDSVVELDRDWYSQVAIRCERCQGNVLVITSSS